jgi:hypothetical protein
MIRKNLESLIERLKEERLLLSKCHCKSEHGKITNSEQLIIDTIDTLVDINNNFSDFYRKAAHLDKLAMNLRNVADSLACDLNFNKEEE